MGVGRASAALAVAAVCGGLAVPASAATQWRFSRDTRIVVLSQRTVTIDQARLTPTAGHYAGVFAPSRRAGFVSISLSSLGPTPVSLPLAAGSKAVTLPAGRRVTLELLANARAVLSLPPGAQVLRARPTNFHGRLETEPLTGLVPGEAGMQAIPNVFSSANRLTTAVSILHSPTPPQLASRHGDACPSSTPAPECETSDSDSDYAILEFWGAPDGGFGPASVVYGRTYSAPQTDPWVSGYAVAPSVPGYSSAVLVAFGFLDRG